MKYITNLRNSHYFHILKYVLTFSKVILSISIFILALITINSFSENIFIPKTIASLLISLVIFYFLYRLYKNLVNIFIKTRTKYEHEKSVYNPTINNNQTVEGVNIYKLLQKYGSPVFVLSYDKLIKSCDDFVGLLDSLSINYKVAYSVKTNNLKEILNIYKEKGLMAEVVSSAEYKLAMKIGFEGSKIIFNGPLKDSRSLIKAINNNSIVNIDNYIEFEKIEKLAKNKKIKIGLRVNTTRIGRCSRFGFNIENLEAQNVCTKIAQNKNIILKGIHIHIGSNISDPKYFRLASKVVCNFTKYIEYEHNINLEYLDFGGGFPTIGSGASYSSLFPYSTINYIRAIIDPIKEEGLDHKTVIFEPGRLLVDQPMVLISSVTNSKISNSIQVVTIDASSQIIPLSNSRNQQFKLISNNIQVPKINSVVFGPTCIENDLIIESIKLPYMAFGDIFILYNAGAYNLTQSSQFIFPRPPVIMINNNKSHIIRKAESYESW